MRQVLESEIFVIGFTLIVYFLAQQLQQRLKSAILNPILIASAVIILFLTVCHIEYSVFQQNMKIVVFFLKPAVVAMGVPLYLHLEKIKKQTFIIVFSQLTGSIVGILSVVVIAKLLGASKQIILSLAPKSVTAPIAIEVSSITGGIPSLTAAVVIIVGIFGSIFGYSILKIARVTNPISQSLAMGTAAHGIGTSRSIAISANYGAYSSLGLLLNGIFTAALTPYILKLMDKWIA